MQYEKQLETIVGVCKQAMLANIGVVDKISPMSLADFCHSVRWDMVHRPRATAEKRTDEVHFIPYVAIRHPSSGKFLTYKRPDKENGEVLLTGMRSIGFGGHMETAFDSSWTSKGVFDTYPAILDNSVREVNEELRFAIKDVLAAGTSSRTFVRAPYPGQSANFTMSEYGLLYDTSDLVGTRHLGVFMMIDAHGEITAQPGETQIEKLAWLLPEEIKGDLDSYENWSKIWVNDLIDRANDGADIKGIQVAIPSPKAF